MVDHLKNKLHKVFETLNKQYSFSYMFVCFSVTLIKCENNRNNVLTI